jgi:hypothetical protein
MRALEVAAGAGAAVVATPVGAPHLWQNLAPGAIAAAHEAQRVCVSDAPQRAQKSQPSAGVPAAGAPHCGQIVGVSSLRDIPELKKLLAIGYWLLAPANSQ